jgi:hypothetical protein
MPGAIEDVDADGRVVWSDRLVGMGVQFETIDPVHQALVDHFVETHALPKRSVQN